jgi:hypothetical protein
MKHKLQADEEFIGGRREQFAYLWAQLGPSVQAEVASYYEVGGADETWDPDRFLEYLQFCYGNTHSRERAQAKLETLRQGKKEPFSDFFIRFEQLLAQSGGAQWDDEQKLHKLRRSLNDNMRTIALHRGVTRLDYIDAVGAYRSIAVDVETMAIEERARGPYAASAHIKRDRDGDVEMVSISAAGTRGGPRARGKASQRANWIPDALYQQRRDSGVCIRCGEDGHFARECTKAVVVDRTTIRAAGSSGVRADDSASEN